MRWLWTIDDGIAPIHDVVVEAEPDTSISALASALRLTCEQVAPGSDPEAAAGAAAPVSGAVLPVRALPSWRTSRYGYAVGAWPDRRWRCEACG